jgi:membrane protein
MTVIKALTSLLSVLLLIIIVISVFCAFFCFCDHCKEKFNYEIMTKSNGILASITALSLTGGYYWFSAEYAIQGDISNGMILIILGLIFLGFMIVRFIKRTNIIYGITCSIIALTILGTIGIIAGAAILLWFVSLTVLFFTATRVVIIK